MSISVQNQAVKTKLWYFEYHNFVWAMGTIVYRRFQVMLCTAIYETIVFHHYEPLLFLWTDQFVLHLVPT